VFGFAQTVLHVRSASPGGTPPSVEVEIETETYVGRCPAVEVVVRSNRSVVGSRSVSTERDLVLFPPTLDFYRCVGAARVELPGTGASDDLRFEVWYPDRNGEKIADGPPVRFGALAGMPEPPADDSIGGVVESNVQPLINAGIGVAGVYLLWDNIDTISDLFE
jgi:hypothetical protein